MQEDDIGLAAFPVYVAPTPTPTPSPTPDSVGPTTHARAASVRRGHTIRLRYEVTDDKSARSQATRLVVKNARHKVVKRFALGARKIATWYSVRWTPKARGTSRYYVYAKDLASNKQAKVGSAGVRVN